MLRRRRRHQLCDHWLYELERIGRVFDPRAAKHQREIREARQLININARVRELLNTGSKFIEAGTAEHRDHEAEGISLRSGLR